ncbi:MAG: hypothetical protein Q9203_002949 [Teloschistes exilis]
MAGGEDETLEERLKAALWFSVGKIVDEEILKLGVNATPQFIGALTEMVWAQISTEDVRQSRLKMSCCSLVETKTWLQSYEALLVRPDPRRPMSPSVDEINEEKEALVYQDRADYERYVGFSAAAARVFASNKSQRESRVMRL